MLVAKVIPFLYNVIYIERGFFLYEYIKGQVVDIYDDKVILECNGIGYAIFISVNTMTDLSNGSDSAQIYIYEHIREDELSLYGFSDKNERQIFKDLMSVSGIGPKVALGILSKFRGNELIKYISLGDEKALSTAPGVGKKTANRMILELKDKFSKMAIIDQYNEVDVPPVEDGIREDAIAALMSLGYDYHQGAQLVGKVYKENMTLEELIKKALSGK